jgi:hypothetical protein
MLVAGADGTAALPDYTVSLQVTDAVGVATKVQLPAPGAILPLGSHVVNFTVKDAAGNSTPSQTTVTITFTRPISTAVTARGATGTPAPGAGQVGGPPTGTTLGSFGPPAISDFRDLAARVTLLAGRTKLAGIYVENGAGTGSLPAFQGMAAPEIDGATFKSFLDPVIAPGGSIAFDAKVKGVNAGDDEGVWTNAFGNGLELALREGSHVPGLPPGMLLKSVISVSLRDGELLALLKLAPVKGLVGMDTDTVLLRQTGANTATKLLQKGDLVKSSPITNISALMPALGSPGQGRWHAEGVFVAKATLVDSATVLLKIAPDGTPTPMLMTLDAAPAAVGTGAKWLTFGLPAVGSGGSNFVASGTLYQKMGNVTASDDTALLYSADGTAFSLIERENGSVLDIGGATFSGFFDPLVNDAGQVAFLAIVQGTAVKSSNKTALWWGLPATPHLVARLGETATDANGAALTGAVWSSFVSHALPSWPLPGPIFLAKLSGRAVTPKNNVGLWALDSTGILRLLLRTNDSIGGRTLASMTLLGAVPSAVGTTRSFNATGSIALLATFSDKTQALVRIEVP